ncbi:F subunit of K+-transporting ATPase (Potass_KdpF) [Mycolicibacterium rhodesiae NBB3]|uniref:F subunit of K+-transporting ATPase (Potass_KdpF) n=1 Tax=Mycolicibacterium rhodesiae (strain NBB3) TaxID=710685 RepID=G8RR43_MYCRN|nr:F subunit of K+-transporting ATPase (Potass_KdpF) [Mycolicibacterium rhodesiae NBB3]
MRWPVNVGACDVRPGLHCVDGGGLRRPRPGAEMGRGAVIVNVIGLVLAVLIAVFLFAALLFPERF